MGLLRKAAHAVPPSDADGLGLHVGQAEPHARAGLLSKSLDLLALASTGPATQPAVDGEAAGPKTTEPLPALSSPPVLPQEITRLVIDDIRALSDGVELPSLVFTALRKRLSITKGALLLYDPARLEYAPWASFGFDQTTLHRMRIPLGANETFNALANGSPIEVSQPEQKSAFQKFFSSREFSSLESIILSPYIFEDTLVGVLLTGDMRHPFTDSAQLLSCLSTVAGEVAPLLQKARGFLMKWSQAKTARPPATPEEQLSRFLSSPAAQGKKFLFLTLSLNDYIAGIVSAHEDLDSFRLREDIYSFLDAFLADLGAVLRLPGGALLICLQDFSRDDVDLFLHQLRHFLSSHFSGFVPQAVSAITAAKTRAWPDEGADVRELMSFFSS